MLLTVYFSVLSVSGCYYSLLINLWLCYQHVLLDINYQLVTDRKTNTPIELGVDTIVQCSFSATHIERLRTQLCLNMCVKAFMFSIFS